MDGIALRHWPKALGAVLGLLWLLSLFSFQLQDPSLTNLRLPSGGIANWLGLPGALLGGSLLELLGTSALLAPLLWLNWVLCARNRPALHRYAFWSACVLLALSGLHGLAAGLATVPPGSPEPGLLDAGLAGWAVRHWSGLTAGPWAGAALLAYVGSYAANRALYAPAVRRAAREARVVTGWLLREGWRRSTASAVEMRRRAALLRRVSGSAAMGLTHRTGLGLRGLLRLALLPPRVAAGWLAALRAPSLAGIKARSASPSAGVGARRRGPASGGPGVSDHGFRDPGFDNPGFNDPGFGAAPGADSFDDWLHTPEPAPDTTLDLARDDRGTDGMGGVRSMDPRGEPRGGARPLPAPQPLPEAPSPPPSRPLPPWRRRPPVLEEAMDAPAAAVNEGADGAAAGPAPRAAASAPAAAPPERPLEPLGTTDYAFERSEAEAAWRQRFQRYARNLDLDWEEQIGARTESGADALARASGANAAVDDGADDAAHDAADLAADDAADDDAESRDAER